jgi:hypothetical protein
VTFESGSAIAHLGDSAFQHCSVLQSMSLPSSIQTISPSCFNSCRSFTRLVLEAGCCLSPQAVSDLRSQLGDKLKINV